MPSSSSVKASCVSDVFVTRANEHQLLLRGRWSRVLFDFGQAFTDADKRPQIHPEPFDWTQCFKYFFSAYMVSWQETWCVMFETMSAKKKQLFTLQAVKVVYFMELSSLLFIFLKHNRQFLVTYMFVSSRFYFSLQSRGCCCDLKCHHSSSLFISVSLHQTLQ